MANSVLSPMGAKLKTQETHKTKLMKLRFLRKQDLVYFLMPPHSKIYGQSKVLERGCVRFSFYICM